MRLIDRLNLWLLKHTDQHLRTDPACKRYQPTRPGSRLDRACRGWQCGVCAHERLWAAYRVAR